jgi:DNA repair photolyase
MLLEMKKRGIPTVVWLGPTLPLINDSQDNLRGLLDYCAQAKVQGILNFGFGMTLREGNREHYYKCLDRDFPGMRERYEAIFGNSYGLRSPYSAKLDSIFREFLRDRKAAGHEIITGEKRIFVYLADFPEKTEQLSLF